MAKYLVVAHETVTNPMLLKQIRSIEDGDPSAEFTLLVPATPVRHLLFRQGTEEDAEAVARKLSEKARKTFEKKHLKLVDALVGSGSPEDAIENEVKANPGYAGFVISTLTREKSRWLRLNLPDVVQSKYGLPVYHVEAPPDFYLGGLP